MNPYCKDCIAKPVDHAIICPVLGVIAAGRCRRIQAKEGDAAFDALHGVYVSGNKRTAIQLRSCYWAEESEHYQALTYSHGSYRLKRKAASGTTAIARGLTALAIVGPNAEVRLNGADICQGLPAIISASV